MHEIALRSGREAIRSYIHQLIVRHTLSDTICGGQLHPLTTRLTMACGHTAACLSCVWTARLAIQRSYHNRKKRCPETVRKWTKRITRKNPSGMSVALVLKRRAPRFVQFVVKTPQEVTGTREFWHSGTNSWCTTLWMWTTSTLAAWYSDAADSSTKPVSRSFHQQRFKWEPYPDSSVKVLNHPGDRSLRSLEREVCRCVS